VGATLWSWYLDQGRDLPWRVAPGDQPPSDHAYRVLVSEIMLQQTTVATVLTRYGPFLERFPTIQSLAQGQCR